MLYYSFGFFITSILTGFMGFGGIEKISTVVPQILFILFLIGFFVSVIFYLAQMVEHKSKKLTYRVRSK